MADGPRKQKPHRGGPFGLDGAPAELWYLAVRYHAVPRQILEALAAQNLGTGSPFWTS